MIPQQTKLEVISNNIANANTVGFKRESVFERNVINAKENLSNVPGDAESKDAPIGSYIDFSSGVFRQTDNPLDIAVEGKGFFVLQDEAGNVFYSRAGHFKLSGDGHIQSSDGKMLMEQGGAVKINSELMGGQQLSGSNDAVNVKITDNGEVFVNENLVGTISIAVVDNPGTFNRTSNQNFTATNETRIHQLPIDQIKLKQGWLEGSNVDVIREMVSMIELQRAFEAGSKVIKTSEASLAEAIRVGRVF